MANLIPVLSAIQRQWSEVARAVGLENSERKLVPWGIVAEKFGVKTALVSGGVLCVISVVGSAVFLPKFVTYDGREGVRQRDREEAERAELLRVSEAEF